MAIESTLPVGREMKTKTREKFYLYKMTVDNGGAPCIKRSLLSLAICKPVIRRTAEKGDIIIGFAANSLYRDNRLIYIAKVSKKLSAKKYYSQQEYGRRPDCIYFWDGRNFRYRRDAKFHTKEDLAHDLGKPPKYHCAQVLLSRTFRYFGCGGPRKFGEKYPQLAAKIKSLAQGHRVIKLPDDLRHEIRRFAAKLWKHRSAFSRTWTPDVRLTTCLRNDGGSVECST